MTVCLKEVSMHIIYAADENYVRHLAASLMSAMDACQGAESLEFHVMSTGITDDSKEKLRQLAEKQGRSIAFYELGDLTKWFDFSFNTRGFAVSALTRLLMGRVLPEGVHRIIYLDCDTIVLRDLTSMWDTDMGDSPLGMVQEPTVNKKRRVYLGLPDDQPYYNSGVLLVNLDLWRSQQVEKQVLQYYESMHGDLVAPDQDALNGALKERIYPLSPCYNHGSPQIFYSWRALTRISSPTPYLQEEDYQRAVGQPAIVHYLGEQRPWRKGNAHPYEEAYQRYLGRTPWKDVPQEQGWQTYFRAFRLFNAVTKPFPVLRWRIIDGLIPVFMAAREQARKRKG